MSGAAAPVSTGRGFRGTKLTASTTMPTVSVRRSHIKQNSPHSKHNIHNPPSLSPTSQSWSAPGVAHNDSSRAVAAERRRRRTTTKTTPHLKSVYGADKSSRNLNISIDISSIDASLSFLSPKKGLVKVLQPSSSSPHFLSSSSSPSPPPPPPSAASAATAAAAAANRRRPKKLVATSTTTTRRTPRAVVLLTDALSRSTAPAPSAVASVAPVAHVAHAAAAHHRSDETGNITSVIVSPRLRRNIAATNSQSTPRLLMEQSSGGGSSSSSSRISRKQPRQLSNSSKKNNKKKNNNQKANQKKKIRSNVDRNVPQMPFSSVSLSYSQSTGNLGSSTADGHGAFVQGSRAPTIRLGQRFQQQVESERIQEELNDDMKGVYLKAQKHFAELHLSRSVPTPPTRNLHAFRSVASRRLHDQRVQEEQAFKQKRLAEAYQQQMQVSDYLDHSPDTACIDDGVDWSGFPDHGAQNGQASSAARSTDQLDKKQTFRLQRARDAQLAASKSMPLLSVVPPTTVSLEDWERSQKMQPEAVLTPRGRHFVQQSNGPVEPETPPMYVHGTIEPTVMANMVGRTPRRHLRPIAGGDRGDDDEQQSKGLEFSLMTPAQIAQLFEELDQRHAAAQKQMEEALDRESHHITLQEQLRGEIKQLQQMIGISRSERDMLRNDVRELTDQMGLTRFQTEIEQLKTSVGELSTAKQQLEVELQHAKSELNAQANQLVDAKQELHAAEAKRADAEKKQLAASEVMKQINGTMVEYEEELELRARAMDGHQQEIDEMQANVDKALADLDVSEKQSLLFSRQFETLKLEHAECEPVRAHLAKELASSRKTQSELQREVSSLQHQAEALERSKEQLQLEKEQIRGLLTKARRQASEALKRAMQAEKQIAQGESVVTPVTSSIVAGSSVDASGSTGHASATQNLLKDAANCLIVEAATALHQLEELRRQHNELADKHQESCANEAKLKAQLSEMRASSGKERGLVLDLATTTAKLVQARQQIAQMRSDESRTLSKSLPGSPASVSSPVVSEDPVRLRSLLDERNADLDAVQNALAALQEVHSHCHTKLEDRIAHASQRDPSLEVDHEFLKMQLERDQAMDAHNRIQLQLHAVEVELQLARGAHHDCPATLARWEQRALKAETAAKTHAEEAIAAQNATRQVAAEHAHCDQHIDGLRSELTLLRNAHANCPNTIASLSSELDRLADIETRFSGTLAAKDNAANRLRCRINALTKEQDEQVALAQEAGTILSNAQDLDESSIAMLQRVACFSPEVFQAMREWKASHEEAESSES